MCDKTLYRNKRRALEVLSRTRTRAKHSQHRNHIKINTSKTVYWCDECSGWHLASTPRRKHRYERKDEDYSALTSPTFDVRSYIAEYEGRAC